MARVRGVETHPLLQRQITQAGMLDEQVEPPRRQKHVLELSPLRERSAELGLRRGAGDVRRGHRALRGFEALRIPPHPADNRPPHLFHPPTRPTPPPLPPPTLLQPTPP